MEMEALQWILHRRVYPPQLVIFAIVTFIENVAVRFYRMGKSKSRLLHQSGVSGTGRNCPVQIWQRGGKLMAIRWRNRWHKGFNRLLLVVGLILSVAAFIDLIDESDPV